MRGFLCSFALLELASAARVVKQRAASAAGLFQSLSPHNVTLSVPHGKEFHFRMWDEEEQGVQNEVQAIHGNDGDAELTAVQSSGVVAGSIVDPGSGMVHQFIGEVGGELSFTSTPSDGFLAEEDPVELEDEEEEEEDNNGEVTPDNDGSVINVMVLWTRAAECASNGQSVTCTPNAQTSSAIMALIRLAIVETNGAYTRSGIGLKLNLVHAYRDASYNDQAVSMGTTLGRLQSTTDSYLKDVHSKRITFKAHVVAMIVEDKSSCGIAYVGPRKSHMFSVTARSCATGYYSFGHEIGHNMGCQHDRGTEGACTSTASNFGWRDPQAKWRDILSYACKSGDCMKQVGGSCTRMPFFSNPGKSYNGQSTGKSGQADLAKQINSVKTAISRYY
jgi:hypothetical protein